MIASESRNGKIVTFYSYKGGTGRTMALANVAWLLASAGKRVLAIDWDLEAPGLHRYFHPFLAPELREMETTPGVIDFFVDFAAAARIEHQAPQPESELKWYERSAALPRFAVPIEWEFPNDGSLDLVPAGRQDPTYALRVASFDWQKFYEALGGGLFLEAVKKRLRQDYDFILIDSRTGMSDTAGICTVHMPDELVVLFTLNQQSIRGAHAIAESAEQQRLTPGGKPSLLVWPVPTRLDITAEKKRTDAARDLAHKTFQHFVARPGLDRASYWNAVEVLHQSYYAYEEVLATFGDKPGVTNTMLNKMEALATYVSGERIAAPRLPEAERLAIVAKFEREAVPETVTIPSRPLVYISYSSYLPVARVAQQITEMLAVRNIDFFWDKKLQLGDVWEAVMHEQIERATVVLVLVGKAPPGQMKIEIDYAVSLNKRIVPVAIGVPFPEDLRRFQGVMMAERPRKAEVGKLMDGLKNLLGVSTPSPVILDPDDPNKGRFGGSAQRNGRVLSATVREIEPEWFEIVMKVTSDSGAPLEGRVEFHLHDTFPRPVVNVPVVQGIASTKVGAYGAFTVGAVVDGGATLLELDLSQNPSYPKTFRES